MSFLLFPDERSRTLSEHLAEQMPGAVVVDAILREADLRVFSQFAISPDEIAAVARDSAQLTRLVGDALPVEFERRMDALRPSLWECYGEYFRSWAIAPLLANALVARKAVECHGAGEATVLESIRSSGWWSYRQQVLEAVDAGLLGTRVDVDAAPGGLIRMLRTLAACLGAWPAGAVQLAGGRRCWERRKWLRSLPKPVPTDVLFCAIGGTSVPIIERLATQLREADGLSSAAVLFHPDDQGVEARATSGVPYQYVDNFHWASRAESGASAQTALAGATERLVNVWHKLTSGCPVSRSLQVLFGWPWWLRQTCATAFKAQFGRLWPGVRNRLIISLARDAQQMLSDMDAGERILDAYQPKAVVALHLYWHRIAPVVLAAKARGIPVYYLQHGVYLARDECVRPLPFDEFMVFGDAAERTVRAHIPDAPVTQVSHCLYDELAGGPREPSDAVRGLKAAHKALVVIATQPHKMDAEEAQADNWWVKGVVDACAEIGALAAIKLHPHETNVSLYENLAAATPQATVVLPHGAHDLTDLLSGADAMVTRNSTVVFEANLLGVPAITVNLSGRRDSVPFAADGGAAGVYEYEQIAPVLADIIQTKGAALASTRAEFLARHMGPVDGQSTRRVARTIAGGAGGTGTV